MEISYLYLAMDKTILQLASIALEIHSNIYNIVLNYYYYYYYYTYIPHVQTNQEIIYLIIVIIIIIIIIMTM